MPGLFLSSERRPARIAPHFLFSHPESRFVDRRVIGRIMPTIRHGFTMAPRRQRPSPHRALSNLVTRCSLPLVFDGIVAALAAESARSERIAIATALLNAPPPRAGQPCSKKFFPLFGTAQKLPEHQTVHRLQ